MNDSPSTNFVNSAQQTGMQPVRIFLLCLSFIIALACIIGGVGIKYHHWQTIEEQQLPQSQQYLTRLALLNRTIEQLRVMQSPAIISELVSHHQQLQLNRGELVNQLGGNSELQTVIDYQVHELSRIESNAKRNLALNELAINEVASILAFIKHTPELQERYQLLVSQLLVLQLLLEATQQAQIPMQLPLIKVQVELLSRLQPAFIDEESSPQQQLASQLAQVNGIFFDKHALLGKWQGNLRVYQAFQQQVDAALKAMVATRQQLSQQISTSASGERQKALLNLGRFTISLDQISLVLTVFGLLLFVVNLTLLASIKKRIHAQLNDLVEFTLAALSNPSQAKAHAQLQSTELSEIQQAIAEAVNDKFADSYSGQDLATVKQQMLACWQQLVAQTQADYWYFADNQLHLMAEQLPLLGLSSDLDNTASPLAFSQLKLLLGRSNCLLLVAAAKRAKANNSAEQALITVNGQDKLQLTIDYQAGQWSGVVVNLTKQHSLAGQVAKAKHELEVMQQDALIRLEQEHDAVSKMVIQAMLQSQNAAVVSGYNAQPVYRQLERVFNWLRQQQIIAQLAVPNIVRELQDVNARQAIYAALFNNNSEAALRQNQIYLQLDDKLSTHFNIDVRLFSRLLNSVCELLLKDQFKHQLLLTIEVVDQDAGQQMLAIRGEVTSNKASKNLPKHIARLNGGNTNDYSTRITEYFQALLAALHAEPANAVLMEQGYQLTFRLPVTVAEAYATPVNDTRLLHTNILVLAASQMQRKTLIRYLNHAKASCETLADIQHFTQQYSLAAINRRKLDVIVLSADMMNYLAHIKQHIDQLPASKKPLLYVLQGKQQNLAQAGLYSMLDVPVCQQRVITDIAEHIANQREHNMLLSAEHFAAQQFAPTQVELLLAVNNIELYQPLWRVLLWLSFKVTVVTDALSMHKHWQTGRYLVLMNEFEQSPFVRLLAGKSISRGVFHIAGEKADTDVSDEVIELTESQAELGKHWHFGAVPDINHIDQLIHLLSPWLKPKAAEQNEPLKDTQPTGERVAQGQANHSDNAAMASAEHLLSFSAQLQEALPPAFDMEQYSKNQGSPELAVFMLEDYIDSLLNQASTLTKLIEQEDNQAIQLAINEINLIASILTAPGLMQLSSQLEQAFINNSSASMLRILEQVKREIMLVKSYADAI